MVGHFRAALIDNKVVGIGWLYRQGPRAEIDVRVIPKYRRAGVGGALFDALTEGFNGAVHAGCDAGQKAAQKFVESRGFSLIEMLFAQRWDGELSDVPPAFGSVTLDIDGDVMDAVELLDEAYGQSWSAPAFTPADLQREDVDTWFARREDELCGVLVARRSGDSWWVGGLGTRPNLRGQGIGRALLCKTMTLAAQQSRGVVLLVPADSESVLRWSAGLGFWTYRSWAHYYRPRSDAGS